MEIRAPMTGVILDVLVAVGESVEVGAELLLVESMKMEIPVESPARGTVTSLAVTIGEQVGEGQLLLVLATN
jgi:acetyl-CoA carboxylase biotin carboxyl carrier protein